MRLRCEFHAVNAARHTSSVTIDIFVLLDDLERADTIARLIGHVAHALCTHPSMTHLSNENCDVTYG
jgi:hypothetical protein